MVCVGNYQAPSPNESPSKSVPLGSHRAAPYVDITAWDPRVYGRLSVLFFFQKKSNFKVSKKSHFPFSGPSSLYAYRYGSSWPSEYLSFGRPDDSCTVSHLSPEWTRQHGTHTNDAIYRGPYINNRCFSMLVLFISLSGRKFRGTFRRLNIKRLLAVPRDERFFPTNIIFLS